MILLDTNVVSEAMRPSPAPQVIAWLDLQDSSALFLSVITLAEIGYGLEVLPEGKRRSNLETRFAHFIEEGFQNRVLAFDAPAAAEYPRIMARRRRMGRPISAFDGQIAAIARSHRLTLATANVRDFEACGIELVNPVAV